jgi:hypothetical protein
LYHLKRTKVEIAWVFEVVAERLELLFKVDRDIFECTGRKSCDAVLAVAELERVEYSRSLWIAFKYRFPRILTLSEYAYLIAASLSASDFWRACAGSTVSRTCEAVAFLLAALQIF